jgi:hypothetical protein
VLPRLLAAAVAAAALSTTALSTQHSTPNTRVQFVFTSDAHYGLTRPSFRGQSNVSAHVVNAALVAAINALPAAQFPTDGGLGSGATVGAIDFVASGADIANRVEDVDGVAVQPAAVSWRQFVEDYVKGVTIAPLFVVPGNHDASDAVGYWKPMTPPVDATAMAGIFNLMMRPTTPRSVSTFRYAEDRVMTSRDIGGVHIVFVQLWPDSSARRWMDGDLARVPRDTPVVIVAHDPPDGDPKHFLNPNGTHNLNDTDRFENLLGEELADGTTVETAPAIEQRALEAFLVRHPNVIAYFHGHSNWNQFYEWHGPDGRLRLRVFRADSPMKGHDSATDETRLSFHVASVDPIARRLTVRECLWNAAHGRLLWGESTGGTLSFASFTQP